MRMCLIFVLVYLSACVCDVDACPNGYVRYENSCYHISHDTENWADAMTICKLENAVLADISSSKEDSFIAHLLDHTASAAWIGASDLDVEGDWRWWPSKDLVTYSNWRPGEPNDAGQENCAAIYNSGLWNDDACWKRCNYVCELPYEGSKIIG